MNRARASRIAPPKGAPPRGLRPPLRGSPRWGGFAPLAPPAPSGLRPPGKRPGLSPPSAVCGRPPWFSGPPLARALKPRGGGRPASRARPLSRPPSPPTYRNMVETWNITRGRVGDPAPSAPDGGHSWGTPSPLGDPALGAPGHPDPIIVCAPGRGVASSLAPGAARVWSSLGCGRPRAPAPFLRTPRPHLRRGPCPCAGPLRRGAPAAASRARSGGIRPRPRWGLAGPAPRASPPAPPLGLVRRFAAPAALAGPD